MSEGVFIAMLTQRFEDVVKPVDVVFDMVGGDTLQRSWQVVKPGGVLVSVVSPRPLLMWPKGMTRALPGLWLYRIGSI